MFDLTIKNNLSFEWFKYESTDNKALNEYKYLTSIYLLFFVTILKNKQKEAKELLSRKESPLKQLKIYFNLLSSIYLSSLIFY